VDGREWGDGTSLSVRGAAGGGFASGSPIATTGRASTATTGGGASLRGVREVLGGDMTRTGVNAGEVVAPTFAAATGAAGVAPFAALGASDAA
jgi:hypothetical protein